ncbi:hypothetical protein SAMD00079811_75690 [Scytonema sp. HK-05]|uniref:hypothetical protein n=1 Tax=Scytonema sp. HK-05 TaxID=1137095 RepID=UPI0009356ED3|nr:hypothetical protein [Scytonema sp. HK-05]OKH47886.1 hypothetical protein NIES2130_35740 [Scytonema sp. HK-05]BAY49940.1 hypothetical protein SAMD00079811_75690 [Scytonema sp. HK-05]
MTTSITRNITTFLEDLKSADLVGISLLPQNLGLRLEFTFGSESGDAKIELYRIVHLVLSQPLNTDDQDFCFLNTPGYEHPYFWASFTPSGDWTPLSLK